MKPGITTTATREIRVAIAGNPNSGKTSIFNALTGARQRVANYPGATVERKEGSVHRDGATFRVVDLPGTYSLTASSPEEIIARNFILEEKPDVVVTVLDEVLQALPERPAVTESRLRMRPGYMAVWSNTPAALRRS